MRITKQEREYLELRSKREQAEKLVQDLKLKERHAKDKLLKAKGIECGEITKDTHESWECVKLELASIKISHFAKRYESWDNKKLVELSRTVPRILDARRVSYRTEVRITPKAELVKVG